jgi:hypothetical protein
VVNVWFGVVEIEIGCPPLRPSITRFVISLDPETPAQVAVDWAITKSADMVGLSATGRVNANVATAALLCALLSNPIVTATNASALPPGSVSVRRVASITPPPGGSGPVSTMVVLRGNGKLVETCASNALPLNVVVAAEVELVSKPVEARGAAA